MLGRIAVDMDDVLLEHAQAFVNYSNTFYGTKITVNDYSEDWSELWKVDYIELNARVAQYSYSEIPKFRPIKNAYNILRDLAKDYTLVIVTSRKKEYDQMSQDWIKKHYPHIFSAVYFAGIWDTITPDSIKGTKAAICRELNIDYLIDDQLKHCLAFAEFGVQGLLFGDYSWNQTTDKLPDNVIRCPSWESVSAYFYGKT